MEDKAQMSTRTDAVDRYLAVANTPDPTDRSSEVSSRVSGSDTAVFARCDAALALAPKLENSPDIAWAFDETRELARKDPRKSARANALSWYQKPGLAWAATGILALALILTSIQPNTPDPLAPAPQQQVQTQTSNPSEARIASITFVPIVISTDLAQTLSEIQPVVALANGANVDSRSIAVLPFSGNTANPADSIYQQVLRQFAAVPGLYLIDSGTAAMYAQSDLSAEEIALQLGVRGIVQGYVDATDDEIRFDLRFTDAAAQGASLNQAIQRPSTELALLQTDIAASVLSALAETPSITEFNESLFAESILNETL